MKLTFRILMAAAAIMLLGLAAIVIHANLKIGQIEVLASDAEAPGRFVTIDGRRWHVSTEGDVKGDASGAPLLLLHGFAVPGHMALLPWADKLAVQRTLIMPDLLGYGYSDRDTASGSHYTLTSYSASLAAILDELGVVQVDVVGHSYGGVVAARFALDYPTRVRRVVFMNSPFYTEPNAAEGLIHLPLGVGRAVAWHLLGGGPLSILAGYCKSQLSPRCLSRMHVKDTTDTVRAMMYTHRNTGEGRVLLEELPRISVPSLVVWGASDRFFPMSFGERLAREAKGKLAVIAGAGHMPYLQQPDAVAQRILEFLRTHK